MCNSYSWSYPYEINGYTCWYVVKLKTFKEGNYTKDYLKKELYFCKTEGDVVIDSHKTFFENDIARILVWSDVDFNKNLEYNNIIKFETLEDKQMFHNYIKELFEFNMNDYKSYAYHNLF